MRKLSQAEWRDTLVKWAKRQRNNTISRQRIIEIAEKEGIDTNRPAITDGRSLPALCRPSNNKAERQLSAAASTASSDDATETPVTGDGGFGRLIPRRNNGPHPDGSDRGTGLPRNAAMEA